MKINDSFLVAHKWTSLYNAMPEKEGEVPKLLGGVEEKRLAQLVRESLLPASFVLGTDEERIQQFLFDHVWVRLHCSNCLSGLDFYLFDIAVRISPAIAGNWMKYLVGEAPGDPMTEVTVKKVQSTFMPLEAVEELSILVTRRMKSYSLWPERKQRWINRNTQAVERARKLWETSQKQKSPLLQKSLS